MGGRAWLGRGDWDGKTGHCLVQKLGAPLGELLGKDDGCLMEILADGSLGVGGMVVFMVAPLHGGRRQGLEILAGISLPSPDPYFHDGPNLLCIPVNAHTSQCRYEYWRNQSVRRSGKC